MDLAYICKRKLLTKLWESLPSTWTWKMLIIDRYSLKIISSFCCMEDLLNADVLDVNTLDKPREPLMCPALYIINPTKESVDMVIKDFVDKAHPTYSSGYVVCINSIEKELFDRLKAIPRIGDKQIKVMPMDFLTVEQRVFSLNNPNAFYHLYSQHAAEEDRTREIERIGDSIASFLFCLNISPVIRHVETVDGALADRIRQKVHDGYSKLAGSPIIDPVNMSEKTTRHLNLIIADRIADVITPLMTEYTMQSLVHDVIEVQKGTITVPGAEGKDVTVFLDDTDEFWKQLRHKHIADASRMWVEEYQKFTSAHKELANIKDNAKDMKKMQEAMRSLPEYMDLANRFSSHRNIIEKASKAMDEMKLAEFVSGEQALGSGVDVDGKPIKRPMAYIQSAVGSIAYEMDRRMREALIFLLSQDYTDADKNALVNMLKSFDQSKAIIDAALTLPKTKREIQKNKKVLADLKTEYEMSRYNPLIKEIVVRMSHNDVPSYCLLDEVQFNSFAADIEQGQGNLTVAAGKTLKKQKGKGEKEGLANAGKKPKLTEKDLLGTESNVLVIFITGAISYSEMKVAYELSEKLKMNIFIGSNYIVNQNRFVKMIKGLGNEQFVDITPELATSKIVTEN